MKQLLTLFTASLSTFGTMGQLGSVAQLGLRLPPQNHCTPVKDQALSGTCWSFASLSFLESEAQRKGLDQFDFSEMFVARHSYLRKIETHLRQKGRNYFTPGGQFHDVLWVMQNKGLIPEQRYSGLQKGAVYHDHAELDTAAKEYVATLLASGVTELGPGHRRYLDSLFNHHLGALPDTFVYDRRTLTPLEFAKDWLGFRPDDYLEITSYTHHPFYTRYVVEDKYNWSGDLYYNVPVQDFIAIARHALQKGFTVCWDGDVTETGFDFERGVAWLNYTGNWQAERQRTLRDSTSTIDHLMHITGITRDKQGRPWYCVKNSWGKGNAFDGYLFMNEAYFNIKTTAIIVHKDAIPVAIRKKMRV
jgi:bleomycin hydrolase